MNKKITSLETANETNSNTSTTQIQTNRLLLDSHKHMFVYFIILQIFILIIGYSINALITAKKTGLADIDALFLAGAIIVCLAGWAVSTIRFFKLLSGNFVRRTKS